jgi:hypothetical protein
MTRAIAAAALALALVATLALAGCAATPGREIVAQADQALAAAPSCCTTLADAKRTPLPVQAQPVEVVIDLTAQAFDFGGNKAFFVLYELPPHQDTYSIVLTSLPGGTMDDAAYFIPRMATYDTHFKVVRYFEERTLRSRGSSLERTVFFNPQDRVERYLAIYGSDPAATVERAYSIHTVTPVFAGPLLFHLHGGADGKTTVRSAPTGKLKIETRGLSPAPR